jgi:3-deoxy-7-phosphoheptulonate synthase
MGSPLMMPHGSKADTGFSPFVLECAAMLIVMGAHATAEDIQRVCKKIEDLGYKAHPVPGANRTAIGLTGNPGPVEPGFFENMPGVVELIEVTHPYKLVSRELKPDNTEVRIGDVVIGGPEIVVMAGPCAVENEEQTLRIAEKVRATGAHLFRGGAFKPRTSPYSFHGLGLKGLKILAKARDNTGLRIITEALDPESLEMVEEYADIIQIGARNMQNFSLLRLAGRARKPVLLKRGMSATLDEFFLAAEYIMAEGNYQVILCERGIRTFTDHTRNTLDLSIVPAVKRISHLPIVVDPSHGTGKRHKVAPMSRAAIAAGADGLIIEVHDQPENALSDGPQALLPESLQELMDELRQLAPVVKRTLARIPEIRTAYVQN